MDRGQVKEEEIFTLDTCTKQTSRAPKKEIYPRPSSQAPIRLFLIVDQVERSSDVWVVFWNVGILLVNGQV